MSRRRSIFAAGLFLGAMLFGGGARASELTEGWTALTEYKTEDALRHFAAAANSTDGAVAREAKLGRGIALLAKQPMTDGQIEEARRTLTELADSGADNPALGARFYLARIAQYHQATRDPVEAANQYRALLRQNERSVWAQTALGRLALLEIYALNLNRPPAERVKAAEELLKFAHAPTAEGELHVAITEAIFYYRLPNEEALPHLLAAERLGGFDRAQRADILLQIAELSRIYGKKAQAIAYYKKFLAENPRDTANYDARMHLKEVER